MIRLIPNLVDSRNTLSINTDNQKDLKKNVQTISSHISSPSFKSSTIQPRSTPLDPKLLNIPVEKTQGNLNDLKLLVNQIRFEDNLNKIAAESKDNKPDLSGFKHNGLFKSNLKRSQSEHLLSVVKPQKRFI